MLTKQQKSVSVPKVSGINAEIAESSGEVGQAGVAESSQHLFIGWLEEINPVTFE